MKGLIQMSKPMKAEEVADYLQVHKDTIYKMVRQKQIPHFRVRRKIFFSMEAIDAWIHEQEQNYEKGII